jgi:formamidopyrimidine-DNA glycosylase
VPELPEVEIIRQGLEARLPGRQVVGVEALAARVFLSPVEALVGRLPGQRCTGVTRRGKYLIVWFERDALLIHLGMTGQVTFWDHAADDAERFLRHPKTGLQVIRQHAADPHTHLVLRLDGGDAVHYRDPRKFGKIRFLPREDLAGCEPLAELGPEPLGPDFSLDRLGQWLWHTQRAVKVALLDQRVAAGVGNIYADEALFAARILPTRRARTLTRAELARLHAAIPAVLEKGIRFRGTSFRDYIDSDGVRGTNQEQLFVYGREGEPCRVCGTPIRRVVLGQRGTHYCPSCQRGRRQRTDGAGA